MRRTTLVCALSAFGMSLLLFGANAVAGDDKGKGKGHDSVRIHLKGFEEVPVVVTNAAGNLELDINDAAPSIAYELSYDGLEGNVAQAHIHIGQKNVNGGIVLWLCQATSRAPAQIAATTPECPQSGTVSGTLTIINAEKGLVLILGAVPGPKNGVVFIKSAVKNHSKVGA